MLNLTNQSKGSCYKSYILLSNLETSDFISFSSSVFLYIKKPNSHVLHSDVFKDLAVVDIPHSLVIPNFGSQQDGSQDDAFPVGGADIQLSVGQQAFQVHLEEELIGFPLLVCQQQSSYPWLTAKSMYYQKNPLYINLVVIHM